MSLSASCQCCDVDTKGFFMWPVNGVRRERKSERELEGRKGERYSSVHDECPPPPTPKPCPVLSNTAWLWEKRQSVISVSFSKY